ncbi:MAG: PAS domain-containing protein [Muribaculaceae bacterium]|nr:PAS domain-containing protein [Muribaculaceae bacterium]
MTATAAIILLAAQLAAIIAVALLAPENALQWCAGIGASALLTAMATWWLTIKPMRTLASGMGLLREQDFGSRLRRTGHGEADRLAAMFNDMMERLHRERLNVRETNRYLDLLVESSPAGIINFDADGMLVSANPAACRIFGVAGSDSLAGLTAENLPGRIGRAMAGLKPGERTMVDARPDEGDDNIYSLSKFSFYDHGFQRTAVLVERLTDLIRRTERQAYDKLIRIMAHEINNSMGAVTSTFDLLSAAPELQDDAEMVSLVESCSHRCRSLCGFIDKYAAVARLPQPCQASTDVDALLRRLAPVLAATASSACPGSHLSVECHGALSARLDAAQMEQVLVNVVKNSAESIDRTPGKKGEITVTADSATHSVTITDNGAGIAAQTAGRLFSPFFTTKTAGESGGTGLTLTAEILRNHGFPFTLMTSADDGLTRFTISLRPTPLTSRPN